MKSDATKKKHWSTGAGELFNLYVEVGEVKLSSIRTEDCRYVECWIKSTFSHDCVREECRSRQKPPSPREVSPLGDGGSSPAPEARLSFSLLIGICAASSFSTLRKKQRGPEGVPDLPPLTVI